MKTALYRYYSKDEVLLYVGISNDPFRRASQRAIGQMVDVIFIKVEWLDTREEAEQLEASAIQNERPLYNMKNEPINFERWRLHAFCNKQWPYTIESPDVVRECLKEVKEFCIKKYWAFN